MASKKGPSVGTGGHGRKRLAGKGPTPPASARKGHPASRRASSATRSTTPRSTTTQPASTRRPPQRRAEDDAELVAGRNPVVEALRARVPALELLVALGLDGDDRTTEALALARKRGLPISEIPRSTLDRRAAGVHQGLALRVPPYAYAHPDDVLAAAREHAEPPLLVALDGVTDPGNLGAIARSVAAFGGHGVVVPERRAAGVTAAAWKASAGALARVPVARATNLSRTLLSFADAGLLVVGLDADGELDLDDLEAATGPIALVVGGEGGGLSRLVGERCDLRVRIPMAGTVESLNAAVAAGVALAEVARRRRGA
ncbi:MAG TPA: 23S rRNA (guanosine(2251)-2'-O)-methyltransferase RlmB [Mycobacteriales bacterium]|nr:23S rRNA (guanosine(2251)-2'-O)-methyltransferase RlmB [Mycobacteriales bacterium]